MKDQLRLGPVELDREEIVDTRPRRYDRLAPRRAQRLAAEVDRLSRSTAVAARGLKLLSDPA